MESYEALVAAYSEGGLHPMDLKNAMSEALIALLEPVRKHFEDQAEIKAMWAELEALL